MRYKIASLVVLLAFFTLGSYSQIGQRGVVIIGQQTSGGGGGGGGGTPANALLHDNTSAALLNDASGATLLNDNP